jgi:hypothetical protein
LDERSWRRLTLAMVLGATAARLAYLAWGCPYTLAEDEAHYWEWSRRLDWSYYSKGPGIALAIRAATALLGDGEWAVRTPAALAGGLAALAVAVLARRVSGSARVGFYGAAAMLLAPMMQAVAIFSTIDGPLAACWAGACLGAWGALERRGRWAWLGAGAAVGAGFLFKYTIVLLPPGIALYALARRGRLGLDRRWRAWAAGGVALAAAGMAPVIAWNAAHGWPTLRHLLGHLGVAGGDVPVAMGGAGDGDNWVERVEGLAEFVASQFGMVGPMLVIAIGATVGLVRGAWRLDGKAVAADLPRPRRWRGSATPSAGAEGDGGAEGGGRLYLVCCAAPVLVFYLAVALFKEAEGNWALGAYVTLLPLAGWAAAEAMAEYRSRVHAWLSEPVGPDGRRPWRGVVRRKPELAGQVLWHFAVAYGVVAGAAMLRLDWVGAAMERAGVRAGWVGRFVGADEMARHVEDLAEGLRSRTGRESFVVSRHYGRASVLAYYLRGTGLRVYCAGGRVEGRPSQYDLWRDTDLDDPDLLGRPAVLVGHGEEEWQRAFAEVRLVGTLRGDRKRGRPAYEGVEYRGMPRRGAAAPDAGGTGVPKGGEAVPTRPPA